MGWSHFLILAKKRGIDCYGSELSKERINYAVSHGIKVIDIKDYQTINLITYTHNKFLSILQTLEKFCLN